MVYFFCFFLGGGGIGLGSTLTHRHPSTSTASWATHFTPPTKRNIEDLYTDESDDEWYVEKVELYRFTFKTEFKKLGLPLDPRIMENQRKVHIGFQKRRVIKKLDFEEGFDTSKIRYIDLVDLY